METADCSIAPTWLGVEWNFRVDNTLVLQVNESYITICRPVGGDNPRALVNFSEWITSCTSGQTMV